MLTPRVGHSGPLQISARYDSVSRNINLSFNLRSQTSIVLPLRVLEILRGSTLRTAEQDLVDSYQDVPSLHSRCTDFKLVTLALDPDASAAAASSESHTVSRPL